MSKITEMDLEGVTVIEIKPRPGPQTDFIASEADIAIYGGAAGGHDVGKGWALAFMAGRHFEAPGYTGAIFRRRRITLDLPGGTIDLARDLYGKTGATMCADGGLGFHRAAWPSGASVRIGAVEEDEDARNLGAARFAFVGFDELTEFTEFQFWKLASRARLDCGVRPHIRASVTADGASWVRELLTWWIGQDGFPIPERSGVLRWVARDDAGAKHWGDSREEAARRAHVSLAASVTFISAEPQANAMHAMLGQDEALRLRGNWNVPSARPGQIVVEGLSERSRAMIAGEALVPDSQGWWLWLDGTARGCAVFLHDPTGDGLQFDSGASASETNLAAYIWGGRLVVEGSKFAARGQVAEQLRAALRDLTATYIIATCESSGVIEPGEWGDAIGHLDLVLSRLTPPLVDNAPMGSIPALVALGLLDAGPGDVVNAEFTVEPHPGGEQEHVVEGGLVGVSCLDSAEYLNTTPAGACRRVTETSGGESLTFEDDRRLPAASEADASELAKLEAIVRKIVDGNFGAGKILIGGREVYIADPRYTTAVSGGINVSTSATSRAGGE